VLACLLTGCTDPEPAANQEDDMTPQQALSALKDAARGLAEAAAPGQEFSELTPQDVPCGGPGGNEWSKVSYTYRAAAGRTDDAEATLARAQEALPGLDLTFRQRGDAPAGPSVAFTGDGFSGELQVNRSGAVLVNAQTDCLDNPDR